LKALELIRNHARRLELQAIEHASEEVLVPLFHVTGGNPKAIEMALGGVKEGSFTLEEAVEHLYEANREVGNIFDYLFAKAWEIMGNDARQVLLVLPFFGSSASKQALEVVSGLKSYQVDLALKRLVELSLLDTNTKLLTSAHRYSIHPLTRSFASAKLGESAREFEKQARAQWVDYYKDFASRILVREKPKERYWNTLVSHGLTRIDPEWLNFRKLLAWADQQGQDQTLVELMLLLIHYMDRRLLYTERLLYAQKAAEAAGKLGWKEVEALFCIDALGWTFMEQGNFAAAKQEIMKAQKIIETIETESTEVIDLRTLAITYLARVFLEQGEIPVAAACIDKAMCSHCSPVIRSRVDVIAGDIANNQGKYSEAIKHYNNALAASKEYSEEEEEFEAYYRLGLVYLEVRDLESAETQFRKITEIEKEGVTIELIFAKYGLASIAKMKGKKDESRVLAEEIFQELSRLAPSHKLLSVIQELLRSFEID
ncbi:MAG: tetratricopeptide repeat protein, partial [Chloroflexota bacterium]|nr:tetratricopeptide repeat protein [Chloroflexota bacterium]